MKCEIVKCHNKDCQAHMDEGRCVWTVDERLVRLAQDPKYKMCEFLRSKVLELLKGGWLNEDC